MISVYLREAWIVPAQLELTPGNSLPPPLPSVSTQHFFFSSAEMSSDRFVRWNHSTRLLAADIPSGWNLRRETPAGLSELKWSWSVTLSPSNLPIILKHWHSILPHTYIWKWGKKKKKKHSSELSQPMGYPILIGVFLNPEPIFLSVSASLCRLWWWSVLCLQ